MAQLESKYFCHVSWQIIDLSSIREIVSLDDKICLLLLSIKQFEKAKVAIGSDLFIYNHDDKQKAQQF